MEIKNAEFKLSMANYDTGKIEDLSQLAVVGKSNVGKSSFINCIFNNNKLCKVGKTPGKTRLLNFFLINKEYYFVDLPGYGFANVSKEEQKRWSQMMERYFRNNEKLKFIILLLDIRHMPTKDDINMYEYILYYDIPRVIIFTKGEKIAKSKRGEACKKILKDLDYNGEYFIIDSTTGLNRQEVIDYLKTLNI